MSEVQNSTGTPQRPSLPPRTTQARPVRTDRPQVQRGTGDVRPSREGGFRPRTEGGTVAGGSQRPARPGFGSRSGSANNNRRNDRRGPKVQETQELESKVIEVRRVTRVVKGGKRMRFSALVVVGDREGKVGFGLKKGQDFQDAVSKATKQANGKLLKITMDANKSLPFVSNTKHKSSEIFLKPASTGTGLIAGGFIRPVLELAGVQNIYSKINRSRNKIAGIQCVMAALKKYSNTK
jgi:small subunit ribosomal protein S5